VPALTAQNKAWLKDYHWPGNIRELKNVIERLMIISTGDRLGFNMSEMSAVRAEKTAFSHLPFSDKPTMDDLQRRYIKFILKETHGRVSGPTGAAAILGMKRTTLYSRMKKLGIKQHSQEHGE